MVGKRVRELLRTTAGKDPARHVGHRSEHQTKCGRRPPIERQQSVRTDAGKQRARLVIDKHAAREAFG